ncbi:MAG: sugar transferase, partial [Gemmatimonadetes bacterium]|nr:sugar transferase [Gemmatimonadota bacterium]
MSPLNPQRRIFTEFLRAADVAVMLLALVLALFVTETRAAGMEHLDFLTRKISPINMVLLACLCLFWPVLLEENGLLRPWRSRTVKAEAKAIFTTVSLGALVLLLLVVVFGRGRVSAQTLAAFWVFAVGGTLFVHAAFRGLARSMRNAVDRAVLIVGSGPRARRVATSLVDQRDVAGYRLLGFVDDPVRGYGHYENGAELVSTLANLSTFLKDNVVDEVFIALPIKSSYQTIVDVSTLCEEQGIPVRIPSDLFEMKISNRGVYEVGGEQVLTFYTGASPKPWSLFLKRGMDIAGSGVALLLLAPLFLGMAIAVKATSRGPVLFRQERLGLAKRRFKVLKFRTMCVDAEAKLAALEAQNEAEFPAFKLRRDPRLTPIGGFLRRTSLDELPQLWNVLRGEMSLVGPRPLAVRDAMGISENWQKRRFSVKPGITCLWQVNGRSNVRFQEWMKLDLEYIDKWSLALDVKILAKTI